MRAREQGEHVGGGQCAIELQHAAARGRVLGRLPIRDARDAAALLLVRIATQGFLVRRVVVVVPTNAAPFK